jgi:hypothetical protein
VIEFDKSDEAKERKRITPEKVAKRTKTKRLLLFGRNRLTGIYYRCAKVVQV